MENIRKTIITDDYLRGLGLEEHYFIQSRVWRVQAPLEFYMPDKISEAIFNDIEYWLEYNQYLHPNVLKHIEQSIKTDEGLKTFYDVQYQNYSIFRTQKTDDIQVLKGWFTRKVEKQEFIKEISDLKTEEENLKKMQNDFEHDLEELIWYVDLGNNLKGDCPFCPPGTLSMVKEFFVG